MVTLRLPISISYRYCECSSAYLANVQPSKIKVMSMKPSGLSGIKDMSLSATIP